MWLWNKFLQYIPTFRLLTVNIFHSKKEEKKKIDVYCPYLMFGSVHFEWFSLFFYFILFFCLLFSFITKKFLFHFNSRPPEKKYFFAFDVHIEEDWNAPSMDVLASFFLSFLFSQVIFVFLAGYWKIGINLCKPISYIFLCIFIHFWSCFQGGNNLWQFNFSGVFWAQLIRLCIGRIS